MAQDMHETFDYDVDEDKDDHELVLTKCRTYCEPRKNIVFVTKARTNQLNSG